MSRSVHLRPAARADLLDRYAYLVAESRRTADRFLAAAEATLEMLCSAPRIGHAWSSDQPQLQGVRVWHVLRFANWLIFYRPTRASIDVIRILHGSRDLPSVLEADDASSR